MGLDNRDYARDGSYTRGGNQSFMAASPMCKRILIVTVAVFIAQIFFTRPANQADVQRLIDQYQAQQQEQEALYGEPIAHDGESESPQPPIADFNPAYFVNSAAPVSIVQDWLLLDTDKVLKQGQIWRLVTTAFCHDRLSIWHIVFNMLFLYWFGQFVEATYGSAEFLCFYLVAAVVASLAYIGLELVTGDRHGAIGASGAVMAVVCVFAMWNPHHTIRMYFLFPIQIQYLLLLYAIYDLHPVLLSLSGTATYTGVAHAAHLGGLVFGYFYYKNDWRLLPYWNLISQTTNHMGKKSRIKRSNLQIYQEAPDDNDRPSKTSPPERTTADLRFDQQLDDVLKKISESGQDSLTERERKILMLGSKRYRNQ